MFQTPGRTEPIVPPKAQENRFQLPGYGLPLDYAPLAKDLYGVESKGLFPTALDDRDIGRGYVNQPLLTLREIEMMRLMNEITDEPLWYEKIYEEPMIDKWKKHAISSGPNVTPKMVDWIIEELKFKAKIFQHVRAVSIYNGDVVKSDDILPEECRIQLKDAVIRILQDPSYVRDYEPESDEHELDIVHPYLFPLVFGRSRILKDRVIGVDDALVNSGKGEIIPIPEDPGITREDMTWRIASRDDITVRPFSTNFQLLPFDVELGSDENWHIASYINNLHPERHKDLYHIIESIINKVVPMWDIALTPLKDMLHSRARIEYHKAVYRPLSKEAEQSRPKQMPQESEHDYEIRLNQWKEHVYEAIPPEPGKFQPWAVPRFLMTELSEHETNPLRIEEQVNLKEEYGSHGLQVIIRIVDLILTPEKPVYETHWHVEGQMNEHICATALYYFDSDNVTEARTAFRQASDTDTISDIEYEPGDGVWLKQIFGIESGGPAVQVIGELSCKDGRLIAYPNSIQHRVSPMELIDRTREGHRRVLVLHLIDPNIRIISTANVPPQRLDWREEARKYQNVLNKLPVERDDFVLNRSDGFPFTMDEAKQFRRKLREERKAFTLYQDVAFNSNHIIL